ncbi:hypothetical protein JCM1840_005305 [Sporobolomyces johnsonii]
MSRYFPQPQQPGSSSSAATSSPPRKRRLPTHWDDEEAGASAPIERSRGGLSAQMDKDKGKERQGKTEGSSGGRGVGVQQGAQSTTHSPSSSNAAGFPSRHKSSHAIGRSLLKKRGPAPDDVLFGEAPAPKKQPPPPPLNLPRPEQAKKYESLFTPSRKPSKIPVWPKQIYSKPSVPQTSVLLDNFEPVGHLRKPTMSDAGESRQDSVGFAGNDVDQLFPSVDNSPRSSQMNESARPRPFQAQPASPSSHLRIARKSTSQHPSAAAAPSAPHRKSTSTSTAIDLRGRPVPASSLTNKVSSLASRVAVRRLSNSSAAELSHHRHPGSESDSDDEILLSSTNSRSNSTTSNSANSTTSNSAANRSRAVSPRRSALESGVKKERAKDRHKHKDEGKGKGKAVEPTSPSKRTTRRKEGPVDSQARHRKRKGERGSQALQQGESRTEGGRILRNRSTTSASTRDGVGHKKKERVKERVKERARKEPEWIELLEIDAGQKVKVPQDWEPPPQPWMRDDPEDSLNDCIHHKSLEFVLNTVVFASTDIPASVRSVGEWLIQVDLKLSGWHSCPDLPNPVSIASFSSDEQKFVFRDLSDGPDPAGEGYTTFHRDASTTTTGAHSLFIDPRFVRLAGVSDLSLSIKLGFGIACLSSTISIASSSPCGKLIPRPTSGFFPFEGQKDLRTGISVDVDVVPVRKTVLTPEEAKLEIERRLERLSLEAEGGVWVPDAQAIRPKQWKEREMRMPDLGEGRLGYDFLTKLPYNPGEVLRNFNADTPETTRSAVRAFDEKIARTSLSPKEKLLARAHGRWCHVNPFPPSVYDRELTCWTHYAPLVHHFELRFELALHLLGRQVRHHLLTEHELRLVMHKYDEEAERIERGERKGYEQLRREALWIEATKA